MIKGDDQPGAFVVRAKAIGFPFVSGLLLILPLVVIGSGAFIATINMLRVS